MSTKTETKHTETPLLNCPYCAELLTPGHFSCWRPKCIESAERDLNIRELEDDALKEDSNAG